MQKPLSSEDLIREVKRALAFRSHALSHVGPIRDERLASDVRRRDIVRWQGRRVAL